MSLDFLYSVFDPEVGEGECFMMGGLRLLMEPKVWCVKRPGGTVGVGSQPHPSSSGLSNTGQEP